MARVDQGIEIDLRGQKHRIGLSGFVALTEGSRALAVVRVDDTAEAERLERLANALLAKFQWTEAHDSADAISVDTLESTGTCVVFAETAPHCSSLCGERPAAESWLRAHV